MLQETGDGGHFISAITGEYSHTVGYTYVDDTDLIQVDLRNVTIGVQEVMEHMQNAINRWEGGLKMSGGAIVPQKSFVYPLGFHFDEQGKWSYYDKEEIDFNFQVKDHANVTQQLTTLSPSEGRCTLGVVLAPDGGVTNAVETLRKKADTWAAYIRTGHISWDDAWQALETTILKTLRYPLPALCLTEKQCNHIMDPVLKASLPKSSIARTYPHKVLYGPKEEGGLNNENLYLYQGTSKIATLTEHLALNTMTGELLRCSIEAAKVEVGIGRNLFLLDFSIFGELCTDSIVKHIWKFAHEHNIVIEDNVTGNLSLQRENDLFLMEQIAHEDFTVTELQHINRCRLHLQVTTLSDIMEGHGRRISRNSLNCIFDSEREKHYKWPVQPRPNQRIRQLWKRALKRAFPRVPNSLDSAYTLGSWLNNYNTWKWYVHPTTKYLYRAKDNNQWKVYHWINRAGRVGRYPKYSWIANALSLPIGVHRATVEAVNVTEVRLTGWAQEPIPAEPFPTISRFENSVLSISSNSGKMVVLLKCFAEKVSN